MEDALDRELLGYFAAHPTATVRQAAEAIGRGLSATHGRLERLKASGRLVPQDCERCGSMLWVVGAGRAVGG